MKHCMLEASLASLPAFFSFLEESLLEEPLSRQELQEILTVAEEIFVNIASYAYELEENPGTVDISLEVPAQSGRSMALTFRDSGTPFNPLARGDVDTTLPCQEREIGGLGILMIKNLMDAVEYSLEDGRNTLLLEKTWRHSPDVKV